MAIKTQKLEKSIQSTLDFITDRATTDHRFASIKCELETILRSLQGGKLTIQIVGGDRQMLDCWQMILTQMAVADRYELNHAALPEATEIGPAHPLLNCDVFCLAVEAEARLTPAAALLLEHIQHSPVAQTVVLVASSATDQPPLASLTTWLQAHLPQLAAIVVPIVLPLPDRTSLPAEWAKLGEVLSSFSGRKAEDLLIKRLTAQFQWQLAQIEPILATELEDLRQEIQRAEVKLQAFQQNSDDQRLKERAKAELSRILQEKEQFFKQVRLEVNQSKAALLDEYDRHSLIHQIQAFASTLRPQIVRRKSAKYLQLQSELAQGSADINGDMMHLCYAYLGQWAIDEWRRIYTSYGNGGVSRFFQTVYSLLSFMPAVSLRSDRFQVHPSSFQLPNSLKSSVAGVACETYYKEVFIGNYILRQVRNQWMGIMFLLTFLTMVGLNQGKNKRALISSFFQPLFDLKQSPVLLFMLLAGIFCSIFLLLFYNYSNDTEFKTEDEAEKLKKQLVSHYQGFVKQAVAKLVQDFLLALDAEEERLRQLLSYVDEQIAATTSRSSHDRDLAEADLTALMSRQKGLNKTLADFEKLKRV